MENRDQLRQLLADHDKTQAEGAALICGHTKRPCSVRAVRSWLNDPKASSARKCPDWAIEALTEALAKEK
ncbi:hypothetical protein ALQ65_200124 [Pseudomonas syringae pv. coriandricola]|uniref:Uncharacterized protein n=1 Tax=Pseudomonas syringae pv. coriandricola TaxID=264453 RepID=A0A3M3JTD0_9PSED|nr:hypothetical protein ALQ65_200124 [Pseudomonas syringae pv. coriandricola]